MAEVTWWCEDGIAWIRLDAPPVNALGAAVRRGLLSAASAIEAQPGLVAAVVHSSGPVFCAGADIGEMGQPARPPALPEVLAAIEDCNVPWLAAVHGAALGGGLELIMACAGRVAGPSASFGLPEVGIGVIPGAGGTVRLPRLVTMQKALQMVTSGKPIGVAEALAAGLLDLAPAGDLLAEAARLARQIARQGATKTLLRPLRGVDEINWPAETARLRARSRGAQASIEALQALEASARLPAQAALVDARMRFLRLVDGPDAVALRYLFRAERAAGEPLRQPVQPVATPQVAGVVGGGTMGAGIATVLLLSGLRVRLLEQTAVAADQARQRVLELVQASRDRGLLSEAMARASAARFSVGDRYDDLSDCDLVIEAVFEDLVAKQDVFRRLDEVVSAGAVLATNTSYLDVDRIAADTRHPDRVLGLHFFAPAHVMKLLEVVRGAHTDARTLAVAGALARRLKKTAVVSGVCEGFIGNRIMSTYRQESERMLEEGALPQDIDGAMRQFGFAMGIFEVQDLSGLDIAWAQRKALRAAGKLAEGVGRISDQLCEAGRFGRKAGRGWYRYTSDAQLPDEEVSAIIEQTSRTLGHQRRSLSADEITDRILSAMQLEGEAILAEGIARSAGDVDVVMVTGYGFPRHRGGPMFMAAASRETTQTA